MPRMAGSASLAPARLFAFLLGCLLALGTAVTAVAQPREETRFLRIGTGSITGTYYPVGGLITSVLTSPPGARPCGPAGGCGVPGLIPIVQTSKGSVDNVEAIQTGRVESGFVQSDIAFGAFTGSGVFAGREPMQNLRGIASLYLESVHIVARPEAGIESVRDLRGRRVSLDVEGSGTLVDARLILAAFGLSEKDIEPVYVPMGQAIGLMKEQKLDALFFVAGYPAGAVLEITRDIGARLVPIAGPEVDQLLSRHRFFARDAVPGGVYPNNDTETATVSVAALWAVAADLDEELVYEMTRTLWHPASRETLDQGHPKGSEIRLETALQGMAIPLHPGAAQFYREQGLAN